MSRKPWRTLNTEEIFKSKMFSLRVDRCRLPDGREMPRYYVIDFPDWVNIVPVTEHGEIVLVEQYRHATQEYTLEIPGGSTDPNCNEPPESAAIRELAEETGYVSEEVHFVGSQAPNPALQSNLAHTFVALNCKKTKELHLDPFEDIHVVTKPISEVYDLIFQGKMRHSIIVAALFMALPRLGYRICK